MRKHASVLILPLFLTMLFAQGAEAAIGAVRVTPTLAYPAAFTFAPNGSLFYGERFTGEIHIFNPSTSSDSLFFKIPNVPGQSSTMLRSLQLSPLHAAGGEQGLLGLALHPDYPSTPYVYAFVTREFSGVHRNQILRITNSSGTGTNMQVLFTIQAAQYHNGGRILFGPDRNLYVVIGDNTRAENAQDLGSRYGKVLRMTAGGNVPSGNPFAGSYVWAYGIRNSFGLAFDPATGNLWETENGPDCNDELNRILTGRNHGWGPSWTCSSPPDPPRNTNQDGPSPVLPKRWYGTPIAPTGVAFCATCSLGSSSEGRLFFGAWNTGQIRRVTLDSSRVGVASQEVVYTHGEGVLSIERAPSGRLYFSDDDAIHRLVTG
jgi:aldose sugar dehydrogenase